MPGSRIFRLMDSAHLPKGEHHFGAEDVEGGGLKTGILRWCVGGHCYSITDK